MVFSVALEQFCFLWLFAHVTPSMTIEGAGTEVVDGWRDQAGNDWLAAAVGTGKAPKSEKSENY